MSEQNPSPAPIGQGDKYALVKSLLRRERHITVDDWIRTGRKNGQSYYALADELNALLRAEEGKESAASAPRVTFESIRRWDPDGEYQRKAQAARTTPLAADPPSGVTPVQFQGGEE